MTDLETLELAKSYMEKLANGIHPITGTAIPDGDVVNDVRLSRCFFYVADVLRQVIERGGGFLCGKILIDTFDEKCYDERKIDR